VCNSTVTRRQRRTYGGRRFDLSGRGVQIDVTRVERLRSGVDTQTVHDVAQRPASRVLDRHHLPRRHQL